MILRNSLFSCLALCLSLLTASAVSAEGPQLIEVRFYHFNSAEKAKAFDGMMKDAVLPVMKNEGITDVGVFSVMDSKDLDDNARVMVAAYESMEQMLKLKKAYANDADFWPNAQDYLMQEPGDPAYSRVESMLLTAFDGMPKLKVPGSADGKKRRFELRTYKSENEIQGLLKVKMFNDGEVELFKKVNLPAVFYGEALVASNLPQLTYMLVHDDEDSQKKSWKDFLGHPEWDALKKDEQYSSIKLKITKHMLTATDYSPIK